MVSFELAKEIEKDVFRLVISCRYHLLLQFPGNCYRSLSPLFLNVFLMRHSNTYLQWFIDTQMYKLYSLVHECF